MDNNKLDTNKLETLWAPWRMAYITENETTKFETVTVGPNADPNCFICQGVFDEQHDQQRFIVRRTEFTITVLNRFPYNNGHLLVAPRCHCGRLDGLTEMEKLELIREIDHWTKILEQKMNPDGFNIGLNLGHSAGAGLPGHLHWHIVPRWNGDTNFVTTINSTKVIPQSLQALWEILTCET
ncbi:MAG: HIT domain-containing protein [Planctomycetaceae bacterium]|jgi:ATP adenylyltransferase|nr:HIT domain-containing protein [Planctomycetaceae bacterium]